MKLCIGFGALFKLQAVNKHTGKIRELTDWFTNTVLDVGLERMGVGSWFDLCRVGTGNATPVVTQTQLVNKVASSNTQQAGSDGAQATAPYFIWRRRTFRFAAGTLNNVNLAEVAIGWGNTTTDNFIWNRALIKDGSGNPTTVTVLVDEYLDVLCEVRAYPNVNDVTGSISLKDGAGNTISTHTTTVRPSQVTSAGGNYASAMGAARIGAINATYFTGAVGAITASPSGTVMGSSGSGNIQIVNSAYSANSKKIGIICNSGLNDINGVFRSARLDGYGWCYQVGYSPTITKNSNQTFSLSFEISWDRYTP